MKGDEIFVNGDVLDRISQAYGFNQKQQLAKHFDISPSSLQNRYKRGGISYDFIVHCALETGKDLQWLLTGVASEGQKLTASDVFYIETFTLRDSRMIPDEALVIDTKFFNASASPSLCIRSENKIYFIDSNSYLSDGFWLIKMDGATSIRTLAVLPGRRLHVSGGLSPFECGVDELEIIGKIFNSFSEAI